jgi:hypothetical protein
MYSSSVNNNFGTGIAVDEGGKATIRSCDIFENGLSGFYSTSSQKSIITFGTNIYDNGCAEVVSVISHFPSFQNTFSSINSSIHNDVIDPFNPNDIYLLKAIPGIISPPPPDPNTFIGTPIHPTISIGIRDLTIDTSNPDRFYPNISTFNFIHGLRHGSSLSFENAIDMIVEKSYSAAYDTLVTIIENFPESIEAQHSLEFLPYISLFLSSTIKSLCQLKIFIESIESEFLSTKKALALARINMYEQDYTSAVLHYEYIIHNAPTHLEQILAELEQAYSFYKLMLNPSKRIPPKATHQPKNYLQFVSVRDSILERFYNLNFIDQADDSLVPSRVMFDLSNYPNPFNPETVINFQISSDSFASSSLSVPLAISIAIYNIKGQRVRTLVEDKFTVGSHSVIWDGTDDMGRSVGNGVYLYRLTSGDSSITRKMLLIK